MSIQQFSFANSPILKKQPDTKMYFTGSRLYKNNKVTKDTDFDFFGTSDAFDYWVEKLRDDGYDQTDSKYFAKSCYMVNKKTNTKINLITVKQNELKLWYLSTFIVNSLFRSNILNSNVSKTFYIMLFTTIRSIAAPFKKMITDNIELPLLEDMYPDIIELSDIMGEDKTYKKVFPF